MKKTVILFLLVLLSLTSLQARTFVLVTGVSNYGDEQNNLGQPTKDAKRFKELMATQTKDITILTSRNVTRTNVLQKLRAICNRAQKGDRIIFYYAGHGMSGGICAYDRLISYDDLISLLSSSQASEKYCFIDACHAGSLKDVTNSDWKKDVSEKNDMAIFVGCRSNEAANESLALGAGFFTQALLKGMRGKSDKNADRKITVIELFKYVHGDVVKRSASEQHPQLIAPKSMYNKVLTSW